MIKNEITTHSTNGTRINANVRAVREPPLCHKKSYPQCFNPALWDGWFLPS